ncbi:MAG: hypothetical protein MK180_02100 [Rhodobacteraceae bacterium]|nr:hypothetical protein [Paracoccaceae bacterium]
MQIIKFTVAASAIAFLAGCLSTDAERAVAGAAAGAIISDATGGSATTGAIIGGAAGAFCDDAGVCN